MIDENDAQKRRKRIDRLKKIIVGAILTAIIVPLLTAILFIILFIRSNTQLKQLQQQYDDLLSSMEQLKDTISYEDTSRDVYSTSEVEESARDTYDADVTDMTETTAGSSDEKTDKKLVYLTFDDGPSSNTSRILDVLDEYGVKATFFVTGKTDETSVEAYKRIVEDGHTLGMHSYSHKYSQIYASEEAFAADLGKLQEYLYGLTGVWSRYYRFPGGSSNTTSAVDMDDLIRYLDDNDITYFDWNIVSGDASGTSISADQIYENCISKLDKYDNAFILMHDAQSKNSTVEALPKIIEYIQSMDDTELVSIDDNTVPVQHKTLEEN